MGYPANLRIPQADQNWILGCNSLVFPSNLPPGQYSFAENVVNRGGIIQTRPGKKRIFSLPGTRAQGLCIYRPYREKEQLVWAIDGQVYYSIYPFTSYQQVPNVGFHHFSPQVYFCQARQGVVLNPDGTLTLLPAPVDTLMMQDGYTASAYYTGTSAIAALESGHNKAAAPWYQAPCGTIMCYTGSRLWIAYQETIYASDLDNPNSFTERLYLAEADGFKLPEPCTGMLEVPAGPQSTLPSLLAFSPFTSTQIQSGVLDRTQWQTTPNFQSIVSSDYGNVAPFGCFMEFALPWMFSEIGLLSFDQALAQYGSTTVNPRDMEMLRSKNNISTAFRPGICGVSFENMMLVSVPSGSRWNRHTWVMDNSPQAQLNGGAPRCWVGIWTGTYPVQYATGEIQNVPRCFELSYSCEPVPDDSGNLCQIHILEDFLGRRTDQIDFVDNPIECSFETKIFEIGQLGELFKFKYAELDIVELIGDVTLTIYYAGIKAHYRKAYEIFISAEQGLPGNPNAPLWTYAGTSADTVFQTWKPQTRTIRTPEFSGEPTEDDGCADTCLTESDYNQDTDKGFQLLFNWTGQLGIREIRLFTDPFPQPGIGKCTDQETGEVNIVSAIGCFTPPKVCVIACP